MQGVGARVRILFQVCRGAMRELEQDGISGGECSLWLPAAEGAVRGQWWSCQEGGRDGVQVG